DAGRLLTHGRFHCESSFFIAGSGKFTRLPAKIAGHYAANQGFRVFSNQTIQPKGTIMPNWCNNTLRVFGPDEEVSRFKEQAAGYSPWTLVKDQERNALNFHSLVP